MNPLSGVGMGLGLVGMIGGMIGRGKSNKELRRLMGQNPQYQANPLAQQRLGLAQTLLNARMPGALTAERNIMSNNANQISNINKVATDSSQALALSAAAQGQTDNALMNLGQDEAQDYQRRYGNLVGAQEGMINEDDKVYQDKLRQFQDNVQIQGAINQNRQSNWSSLANFGLSMAVFGLSGGFNGLFGGGANKQQQQPYTRRAEYVRYIPPRNSQL